MGRAMRSDPEVGKRMTSAAILFAAAMLLVGGSIAWTVFLAKGEAGVAGDAPSLFVCFSALIVPVAAANVFVAYGKLRWSYRCPQCGARVPRVPKSEAGTRI